MELPKVTPARISNASYLRLILIVFALLVMWLLRDIILLIFLAMILSVALSP